MALFVLKVDESVVNTNVGAFSRLIAHELFDIVRVCGQSRVINDNQGDFSCALLDVVQQILIKEIKDSTLETTVLLFYNLPCVFPSRFLIAGALLFFFGRSRAPIGLPAEVFKETYTLSERSFDFNL